MKLNGQNASWKTMAPVVFMVLVIFVEYIGLFNGINNYFYDLFFRLRGSGELSNKPIIIAIDNKTLEKLGRWPLKRLYYASLLRWLKEADTVAFDIIMTEPSKDDAAVAEAIRQHGKVVLPVLIDDGIAIKYPVISFAPDLTGHVHLEQDIDGVVREVYHTLLHERTPIKSFSSVVYETATGKTVRRVPHEHFQGQKANIVQLDRMNINYCGEPGTFERISLSDILEGIYPPSFFKNRICLIGITATGVGDIMLTPFSQERKNMPGIEVHANILNTLLLGNAIHITPYWARWLLAIFLALSSSLFFIKINELRAAILALGILLCIAVIIYILFSTFNVWLAPSIFFFTVLSTFIIGYAFKFKDAVIKLDLAYMTVIPHLRWYNYIENQKQFDKGIRGLLTPGGIYSKAQLLSDITSQLIFEKELTDRAIFSDIQAVILFGPDRATVLANNLAIALYKENSLDMSSIDAMTKGMAPFILDKPDIDSFLERLYSGDNRITFNVFIPLPEKRYFKVDASLLSIEEKKYTLFIFSDITKIKELEIFKGHVVSLVSHEIKTPMTSIQGFGEILFDSLEGEMKEFAGIIHRESERLIRFLNTFLDISRIEEGRQIIKITSTTIPDIVEEVVLELKAIAGEKNITIGSEIPGETNPVMIDRDLTKQCLVNLVENAIKYSPQGGNVTIRLIEDIEQIQVDIVDHGIGIREKDIDRIFDKFYRAASDGTENIKGSGLGLTFVKEVIEAQGGKVSVESRPGKGSKFSIIFSKKGGFDEKNSDCRR
ncbi:MAG: CHASE2 domain-containing protein [Proteobacteria bacterium]|nr:CHASE2 domain-containing protein [Pseudomonadota bacterium]